MCIILGQMKILIYLGTSRQGNYSQHVAEFVQNLLNERDGVEAEIISSQNYKIDFDDEGRSAAIPELTEKVEAADGFVIVSPEYNHSYPATLKYLLDLNYNEFYHKPVGIVAVSMGSWGGTRMTEHLLGVLKSLGLLITRKDFNVTNVRNEIEDGQFTDPEKWATRAQPMIDELLELMGQLNHETESH